MMIIGSSSLLVNSQNSSFRFFLCVLVLYSTLYKREGFLPAWNMNQNNWVTILLDGTVPDEEILAYLDSSFADAGIKGRKR